MCATTRAAARRLAAPPLELEQLPDELLVDIGRKLLAIDLTALLRLVQANTALRARLAPGGFSRRSRPRPAPVVSTRSAWP